MTKSIGRGAWRALWALAVAAGAASCAPEPPSTPTQTHDRISAPALSRPAMRPAARPDGPAGRSLGSPEVLGGLEPPSAGARADRSGRFVVQKARTSNPRYVKTRDSGLLEEVIKDMNATIGPRLPVDVPVIFAELGQANAFYSPKERRIVVSYELLDEMIVLFLQNADRDDPKVVARVAQQTIDTLSFVVYHEAAHAMIDLDELPITGREEDAADQLATVMIVTSAASPHSRSLKRNGITQAARGGEAAINGALYFLLSSRGRGRTVEDLPLWDEHSLSEQRFYNILTWVYGSDPRRHANLVQQGILPESRAARAPAEYAKMLRAWATILKGAGAV